MAKKFFHFRNGDGLYRGGTYYRSTFAQIVEMEFKIELLYDLRENFWHQILNIHID